MKTPVIRLYDMSGIGVIIGHGSGVLISNQTGGTSCLSPQIEGIFVPLRDDYTANNGPLRSPEQELIGYFTGPKYRGSGATGGIDSKDADFIESVLARVKLHPPLSVDRQRLAESHEAWIHILIDGDETTDADLAAFASFQPYPRKGILTWNNSD